MKGKDKQSLRSKTVVELTTALKEKRDELAKIRMELAMNKVKNVHATSMLRRDIAIIKTLMREKDLANG